MPLSSKDSQMRRFLVQVSRDGGFDKLFNSCCYENGEWRYKPRDRDHGRVKPGDQLLIYCTSSVPRYGMTLAFSVNVKTVSPDHIRFDTDKPKFFSFPLRRAKIHDMVNKGLLPDVFRKCGQQGFSIAEVRRSSAEVVLGLLRSGSV